MPTTNPTQTATHPVPALGIDLTAAHKVVGINSERRAWLDQMLTSAGMSPGTSSRAHARAFRFAASLERAGYIVAEGPYGPRGGRRFIVTGYGGPALGIVRSLQADGSCLCDLDRDACECFTGLSLELLRTVRRLTRKLSKGDGYLMSGGTVAALIRSHGESTVEAAATLYLSAKAGDARQGAGARIATGSHGLTALVEMLASFERHTIEEALGLLLSRPVEPGTDYDGLTDLRLTAAALVAAESS